MPQSSITKIYLKITCLKFHSNFPGANELRFHKTGIIQGHHWNIKIYFYVISTKPSHRPMMGHFEMKMCRYWSTAPRKVVKFNYSLTIGSGKSFKWFRQKFQMVQAKVSNWRGTNPLVESVTQFAGTYVSPDKIINSKEKRNHTWNFRSDCCLHLCNLLYLLWFPEPSPLLFLSSSCECLYLAWPHA